MRLWIYRDRSRWCDALASVAIARGHDARTFADPRVPDRGAVFARIHHHPTSRLRDKAAMAHLAVNPDLHLVPGYRSAVLYDDKAEQVRQLARWMPRTEIAYSMEDAEIAVRRLGLPLISKCAEGAGSHNVRLIETAAAAMDEARQAFGAGIAVHYGQRQQGYVLWQQFCARNSYDYRVIAIGTERMILRRGNRDDRPMASGSNREVPIEWPDREASDVMSFADSFFAAEAMTWCGIDVVRDHASGRWVVLECTTGWPLSNMPAHRFVSGRSGADFWSVAMEQMEAGACR